MKKTHSTAPFSLFFKYVLVTAAVVSAWGLIIFAWLYFHAKTLIAAQAPKPDDAAILETEYAYKKRYIPPQYHHIPPFLTKADCVEGASAPPHIDARGAIVIDAATGAVLYEKEADTVIPPASLTKLAAIYTVMEAVEEGRVRLSDTLTPPYESWAQNIPPGSSLMFLGKNQTVTVEELILGMSVVSGNDAATALAIYTEGSVESFVEKMNLTMQKLGLHNTYFEEPTGLSEFNRTTARDFARFSYLYLQKYPENLKRFHAVTDFMYPQEHNTLVPQQVIYQKATNNLLTSLEGCDGIKTGFIYESGFNIALTAERNGTRFIAVILGGGGSTAADGRQIRKKNGTALMEWAFANFETLKFKHFFDEVPCIPVLGSDESARNSSLFLTPFPACSEEMLAITVLRTGRKDVTAPIQTHLELPPFVSAPVTAGTPVGSIVISQQHNGSMYQVAKIPLVASKDFEPGSKLSAKFDLLAAAIAARMKQH